MTCVALVAVLGLTGGRMSLHTAAAAAPCAGPFESLDAQTAFGGTRYEDRGSTLSVAPLTAHPVIWQFALSLPPRHGEHAGDTYYGYAHATPSPAGTRLCSSAPASFVPADPYAGHPPHAVALRLDGVVDATHLAAHVVHLSGTVPVQFFAGQNDAVRATSLKVEGIIQTDDLSANINVWVDGTHYHLKTDHGQTQDPGPIAARVLALIQAQDWNALYPYLADQIRVSYTQGQFVQSMASQGNGGVLVGLAVSGTGHVSTSQLGYTFDDQPISETTKAPDGTTATTTTHMYLLYEDGMWHYVSTDPIATDPVNALIAAGQP